MTQKTNRLRRFLPLALGVLVAAGVLMLASQNTADGEPQIVRVGSAEPAQMEPTDANGGRSVPREVLTTDLTPQAVPQARRRPAKAGALANADRAMIAALLLGVRQDPKALALLVR